MLDDQHEANIPDAKRRTRVSKGTSALTQEQRDALNQVFYGIYRGALGQNNFYREFSKRNQRQADSLEAWKNQKKTKKTPEQYAAMQAAGTLPKPWFSARQSNRHALTSNAGDLCLGPIGIVLVEEEEPEEVLPPFVSLPPWFEHDDLYLYLRIGSPTARGYHPLYYYIIVSQ